MAVDTHDLGPLYWHFGFFATWDGARVPLFGRIPSQEVEPPFRRSNAFFVRIPLTSFGVVFGKWATTDFEEEEALLLAMHSKGMDLWDADDSTITEEQKDTVRKSVSAHTHDINDEWEVLQALNLT